MVSEGLPSLVLHHGDSLMMKLYFNSVKMWEAGERKSNLVLFKSVFSINMYHLVPTSSSMRLSLSLPLLLIKKGNIEMGFINKNGLCDSIEAGPFLIL